MPDNSGSAPVSTSAPKATDAPAKVADSGASSTASGDVAADAAAKAKAAASSAAKAAAPAVPSVKPANPATVATPDVKTSDVVVPPSGAMPLDFVQEDTAAATSELLAEVVHKIGEAHNVLVALSSDPSVDEMAAAIGLSMYLDKLGKRATTIYSGTTPNALEFLKPEETFEPTVDSLQDFVIALNKEKADHLRYKLDGDYVKIYITPYRSKISKDDLEFSYGDFNVDLVMALDVANGIDLDAALREHGRIMHDAVIIDITTGNPGKLAEIEWSDKSASSVSEMIARLLYRVNSKVKIDKDEATAFLTGIVAATNRFSNLKTTPETMRIASKLMESGANQQLVAKNITPDVENEIFSMAGGAKKAADADPTNLNVHKDGDGEVDKTGVTDSAEASADAAVNPVDADLLNDLKAAEASLAGAGAEVTDVAGREPLKIDSTGNDVNESEPPIDEPIADDNDKQNVSEPTEEETPQPSDNVEQHTSADDRLAAKSEAEFTLEPESDMSLEPEFSFDAEPKEGPEAAATELLPEPEPVSAPVPAPVPTPAPVEEVAAPESIAVPAENVEPVAPNDGPAVPGDESGAAVTSTGGAATPDVSPEEPSAPANKTEKSEHSEGDMPGEGFVSNKPEKVIQPPEDMLNPSLNGGMEKNKYGHMLEEALASANEVPPAMMQPTTPMPMPAPMPMPSAPTSMPSPMPMPAGNPAAMGAPTVAGAPEINGVPQINYMPMPGDGVLPPPPTPPINMNAAPVSGPGGMPMPAVVPVAPPAPTNPAAPAMPNPAEAVLPTAMPITPAAPAPAPTPTSLGPQPAMQDQVYAPQAVDPSAFRIPGVGA